MKWLKSLNPINKTKIEIEKIHRYIAILLFLMTKFRDVFPKDLQDGLPPSKEVYHPIKVDPRLKPIRKIAYRHSHSKAHEVE